MLYISHVKKRIFYLFIISFQISSILSNLEKCYSIKNCESCPELDFCAKCKPGFIFNKPKTKCNANKISPNAKKNLALNNNLKKNTTNNANNILPNSNQTMIQKNQINQKPAFDPFANIPFASIEKMKQKDLNRVKINKMLIIILIVLVLSIIVSAAYDLFKKIFNRVEDDDIQEESSRVAIH